MSSPVVFPGTPQWPGSAQQQTPQADGNDNEEPGVTVKPMRLKVLYTFDDQNKTNCLARWPQVLQIRTVAMDETTSIGVIELKTCIQAIVQCSPELVAKLGQDYTVYAYDYSEYDNPLVGQGMLSWALAAASPTPEAPANQSRQLITGRVCKNIQGLFSNGVAETLEVKLRLVPVPTVLQSEYLSSMEKYRELSKIMPTGFDHNEWFTFLQSNPNVTQVANKISTSSSHATSQGQGFSMEVFNQLLSPSLSHNSADPFNNPQNPDFGPSESTSAGGRKGTPKPSRPSSRTSTKRPYKRRTKAVVTGGNTSGYEEGTDGDDAPATKKRAKITKADWNSKSSFGTASDSLRVTASTAGSLRLFRPIALAPGASISGANHLQDIPRAPTPVPNLPSLPPMRDRAPSQSGLRRDSMTSHFLDSQPRQYNSPYQMQETGHESQEQIRMSIESAMTSPEKNDSAGETPPEFGSSPPVLRTASPLQFSPAPSSPILPQMPRPLTDSGFMSGDISDLFEDDDEMRPIEDEDIAIASKYSSRRKTHRPAPPRAQAPREFVIEEVTPGPPELLPTKMLPRAGQRPKAEPKVKVPRPRASTLRAESTMSDNDFSLPAPALSAVIATENPQLPETAPILPPPVAIPDNNQFPPEITQPSNLEVPQVSGLTPDGPAPIMPPSRPASRMLSRTASVGSLTLPTVAASDPVLPPSNLQRCQSMSEAPHAVTDFPGPIDQPEMNGVASAAVAKKNAQRKRLEHALDNGEMPPYCSNCGAIETPAWRRAWTQDFKGDPGYHEYSERPGRVTAIEILERDETGKPSSYKLFKKQLAPEEDKVAFTEVILCNPCGIWLSKYRTQRPEDKWIKDQERAQERANPGEKKGERKKRERSSRSKRAQSGHQGEAMSEAYLPSETFNPFENGTFFDGPQEGPCEPQEPALDTFTNQPQLESRQRPRASSMHPEKRTMTSGGASAALRRAIQSSPARFLGTRHSPIELEEDLGTTRRLLFPSPRRDASINALGEMATNVTQPPFPLHSPIARSKDVTLEISDKENCPPRPLFDDDEDDELRKLFEEEMAHPPRPTTPVQKRPDHGSFKTPTRPTPNHRPITRSISRSAKSAQRSEMLPQRTPSKTPSTAARRRSERLNNTVIESPFTATLNRLLREANETHDMGHTSPSRHLDLGLDFSALPDLAPGANGIHSDALTFHMPGLEPNHQFFSTDYPMPSSPPRFDLYEDPITMGMQHMDGMVMDNTLWSDFPMDDSVLQAMGEGIVVDANGHATFVAQQGSPKIKTEPGEGERQENQSEEEA